MHFLILIKQNFTYKYKTQKNKKILIYLVVFFIDIIVKKISHIYSQINLNLNVLLVLYT